MERSPREIITRTALLLTAAGLCLTGCTDPPRPSGGGGGMEVNLDRDGDGAPNVLDPYPDVANPTDWDVDGILNAQDLHPHKPGTVQSDTNNGNTNTPQAPTPGGPTGPNSGNTQKGCLRDRDCDGISDTLDPYPDIYDPGDKKDLDDDWDDDGLPNNMDSAPRNRDRDMDGKLDGYDPDPNNPNDSINEPSDNDPYTNDKDRDNDGVDDIYDSAPNDPYEN